GPAQRVAHILYEQIEPAEPPRLPRRLRDLRHAAQPQHRLPPRLRRAHPAPQVLLHLHLKMEAQLLLQLAVRARTMHESAEAFLQLGDETHGLLLRPSDRFTGPRPPSRRERGAHTETWSPWLTRRRGERGGGSPGRAAFILEPSVPRPDPRS